MRKERQNQNVLNISMSTTTSPIKQFLKYVFYDEICSDLGKVILITLFLSSSNIILYLLSNISKLTVQLRSIQKS